nr:hypothetical protein GTC16762_08360 [Pigmentibacter ruber]
MNVSSNPLEIIKEEILSSVLLYADEIQHRMLGGDEKILVLMVFFNQESSYFEIRNTHSGDLASEIF